MAYLVSKQTKPGSRPKGFGLGVIDWECKFSSALSWDSLAHAVPVSEVQAVVAEDAPPWRERQLNAALTIWLVIAMNPDTYLSIGHVLRQLASEPCYLWPDPDYVVAGDSAISYRRYQLSPQPLVAPFHRVCRPMATPRPMVPSCSACG